MTKKPVSPMGEPSPDDAKRDLSQPPPSREAGVSLELTEFSWRGPLPPPQVLKQINDIIPGGAERLMAQFERETQHRHLLDRRAQNYPLVDQLAARAAALIFALACIGVAIYAINANQPWVAAAFGAATVAMGVSAFLRTTTAAAVDQKKPPPSRRQ